MKFNGVIAMGFLASVLGGCGMSYGQPAGFSNDEVKSAALKIVYPLPSCEQSYLGGSVEKCDLAAARLKDRRREFENYDPAWMREPIAEWFDFAERQIKETREDCVTQKSRKRLDEYRERQKAENKRARDLLREIESSR